MFTSATQKIMFSFKNFFSKCEFAADLVTFTEKIFNGKRHFLCSEIVEKRLE